MLLQVFDPLVDEILYSPWWKRWQRSIVVYGETIEVEPDADLSFLLETPDPESMIVSEPTHIHEIKPHPNDWEYSCASYLIHKPHSEPYAERDVESYGIRYLPIPVKPPWVPRWVVQWTELARIVPDYTEHCPDTLPPR